MAGVFTAVDAAVAFGVVLACVVLPAVDKGAGVDCEVVDGAVVLGEPELVVPWPAVVLGGAGGVVFTGVVLSAVVFNPVVVGGAMVAAVVLGVLAVALGPDPAADDAAGLDAAGALGCCPPVEEAGDDGVGGPVFDASTPVNDGTAEPLT